MSGSTRPPSVAERMTEIGPFHVMELLKRAAQLEASGRDIVHMEVGEPDFPTPQPVLSAGADFLRQGHVHYTPAVGIPELRCAIAELYLKRHGLRLDPARVIVTAGASGALLLALGVLVNAGDTVLMADPGYPCYRHFVRFYGGEARLLAVGAGTDFQPTVEQAMSAWSNKTRGLIVASPANPTGGLVDGECLRALGKEVAKRDGAFLVDEIYHGLTYGLNAATALGVADDAFIINSFSKYFGMTGWRLGWLVAPARYVRDIEKLAQNLFICASAPAQYAALAAFRPETLEVLEARRLEFQRRRDMLLPALRRLGFGIEREPCGAFYLYADVSPFGLGSAEFSQRLIEEAGVAITPGLDFGVHGADRHVRFAYTTSLERLAAGVARIEKFLAELHPPQASRGSR